MYCQNKIKYTVQAGDSLYRLAKTYHTTVTELILGNPGVNPYNLQIGMQLNICPGEAYEGGTAADLPGNPQIEPRTQRAMSWVEVSAPLYGDYGETAKGPENPDLREPDGCREPDTGRERNPGERAERPSDREPAQEPAERSPGERQERPSDREPGQEPAERNPGERPSDRETAPRRAERPERLPGRMRLAWINHVYWVYILLICTGADTGERPVAEEALMQTADEITDAFAVFLPVGTVRQLRNLLTEHVELEGEVIDALRAGHKENYDSMIREWYANLNKLVVLLGEQEPYRDGVRRIRNMLLNHLDLIREEMEFQVRGDCQKGVEALRRVLGQTLAMADYFAGEAGKTDG